MTPPDPTRMLDVSAAIRLIRISGEDPAKPLVLWCSATQKRV